jgi:exopolyphosphatase/guanosine-5'-triphosphate,3'-diphosphate pyrophosphatase
MNLAALDLGSNSFHLLVARASSSGSLTKLASHKAVLRLGGVVQQHGRLPAAVFEKALDSVGEMVDVARAFQAERTVAVGTSALRDAGNGADFCRAVSQRFGVAVELVSGKEEGQLVYRGARSAFTGRAERVAVIDIGGGSVEIAVGDGENSDFVESLPLGFLRLAQVVGAREAGPAASEAVRARVLSGSADVAARLRALRPDAWVFSGGTARALGKLLIAGPSGVTGATVRHVARELGKTRPAQLLQLGVDETRVDTLALGAAVFGALVEQFALSTLHVSSGGLREGMLLRELSRARLVAASSAPVRDVQLASAPAWAL